MPHRSYLNHITRGYAASHLTGAPTQMPPLILYDYIMIQFEGYGGTSHTREPLSEIAERPYFFIIELMLSKNQYLSPTRIDQFCGYLPAMNHL